MKRNLLTVICLATIVAVTASANGAEIKEGPNPENREEVKPLSLKGSVTKDQLSDLQALSSKKIEGPAVIYQNTVVTGNDCASTVDLDTPGKLKIFFHDYDVHVEPSDGDTTRDKECFINVDVVVPQGHYVGNVQTIIDTEVYKDYGMWSSIESTVHLNNRTILDKTSNFRGGYIYGGEYELEKGKKVSKKSKKEICALTTASSAVVPARLKVDLEAGRSVYSYSRGDVFLSQEVEVARLNLVTRPCVK